MAQQAGEETSGQGVRLFLSCVSDEFGVYRDAVRRALTLPNVDVKIQENFKPLGGDTLHLLEDYIENCEAVVHFVGEMAGSTPASISIEDLLVRRPGLEDKLARRGIARQALASLTYAQWEAWLAIGFDRDLLIVAPAHGAERSPAFAPTDPSRASQATHLQRLAAINRYPAPPFTNTDNLVAQVVSSGVIVKALVKAEKTKTPRQPRNLPFASLGSLFVGRDTDLNALRAALVLDKEAAVVGRALHGLGGVGKTRLAIEYAFRHAPNYSALLFVRADDPVTLDANLAALASTKVLDLKEKDAAQDEVKIEAVLRWLSAHPTWLMILDNVDDEKAVAGVNRLMARLQHGHVIVTARASNFPASLRKLQLDVLEEDVATAFLLDRTRDDRVRSTDDSAQAREIARELGGLALGLEQAGAYIATEHIGFARYLKLWRESREKVIGWFDPNVVAYGRDTGLAATWATSVDRLSSQSRRVLDRLAMLAPDPIPDSLIDVTVPGETPDYDAHKARSGLYAYSLITQASGDDGSASGFVMHRLVQDFASRAMTEERRATALGEAVEWANAALKGEPQDVREWPVVDPLAPHALAVATRADKAGVAAPTARVFLYLGLLFHTKARYAEAEPLLRRALAINEARYGPDRPELTASLNNLALLLKSTNRAAEAEPLYRHALAIDEIALGRDHVMVAFRLSNLATLLRATNRPQEAEKLHRRALAIREKELGLDALDVAQSLNDLGVLLRATNRHQEAEVLLRRAFAIRDKEYGDGHTHVAQTLNNLAGLLRETNRHSEAEPLFRRAIRIWETHFGPEHPDLATSLSNLALLLGQTNRKDEALLLARRALAIFEKSLGKDHPNAAKVRAQVAALESARTGRRE